MLKKIQTTVLLFLIMGTMIAQEMPVQHRLFEAYVQFKEANIMHRRFKHRDIQPLIDRLEGHPDFSVKKLGESIEGRSISMVSIGEGKTSVLLWSQMHGDEPTATMAIMDIFNFFSQKREFEALKKLLKKELSLHFIPMLNPDGAEKYQRRNALGVDLNRDALRLQNPEARILKRARDELDADWGFNLHDQSRYYSAGLNPETASISFLAPAYNYEKSVNLSRANAMRLIGEMNRVLQPHIPGRVARYSDTFEPRAFGDNIQKWGTSTILIESGGLSNDREKQFLRKMNFLALLSAFESIAKREYEKIPLDIYETIPFNKSNRFSDLILRKANVLLAGNSYVIDIAFRQNEIQFDQDQQYYMEGSIRDIGDLSTSYAYNNFDASAYLIVPGHVNPHVFEDMEELKKTNLSELLEKGFTNLFMKKLPDAWELDNRPFCISEPDTDVSNEISIGKNPSLLLVKEDKIEYVLVNGKLFDLKKEWK